LGTNYRIFQAVTQRGKGGTYKAIDLSQNQPRLCIVKEGRKNGELGWNGQDGFLLVKNEFEVLSLLKNKYKNVPRVYDSFTLHENFYFVMEYIDGKSLSEIMQPRRRRLSFGKIIKFAYEIAEIIEQIHLAGWVWNDCKPSNLILTPEKTLRPIDFEGAFPIDQTEKFDWHSKGFSDFDGRSGKSADFFALGAVLYFLLTGRFFTEESREKLARIRRDVPKQLENLVETLLFEDQLEISEIKREFKKLQKTKS